MYVVYTCALLTNAELDIAQVWKTIALQFQKSWKKVPISRMQKAQPTLRFHPLYGKITSCLWETNLEYKAVTALCTTDCIVIYDMYNSALQSKNTVCANIKHKRYFH